MTDPQHPDALEAAAREIATAVVLGVLGVERTPSNRIIASLVAAMRRHGLRGPPLVEEIEEMAKRGDWQYTQFRRDRAALVEQINRLDYALRVMVNVFRPCDGEPGPDQHVEVEACRLADDALRHAARGTVARALAAPADSK